jgi:methyl-accepting chemotaxis protein
MASASKMSIETSNGVALTATAAGQISAAIQEIGESARASLEKAQAAMLETDGARNLIVELSESVKRIGSVIDIISKIASQTNLLALNASIEASRGGVAGKGFAVVASEIKALAAQTSRATQDIAQRILAIQDGTNQSVKEMSSIAATMNDVCTAANNIASALEQQGLATRDILNHAEALTKTRAAETGEIRSVEDATAQGASAAGDIHNWTQELSSRSADLESKVEGFFARVRII